MFAPLHFQALAFSRDQRILLSAAVQSSYPPSGKNYNDMVFGQPLKTHSVAVTSWEAQTGTVNWSTEIKSSDILEIGFSHSQDFVLVAAQDRVVVLSAIDGSIIHEYPLSHYEGNLEHSFISGATFSYDLRLLAIASFSGIAIIDTESAKMIQRLRAPLKYELGRPEFIMKNNQLRAFDAHGNVFLWDLASTELRMTALADGLNINYNGPATMPILSLASGRFLVNTQTYMSNGGPIVNVPSGQPAIAKQKLCETGDDSDLPPLQIRQAAKLTVWSAQ
jgi:hypothetical protein